MADPLLTALCTICHANPPKYTCPGCSIHFCSVRCNKTHKAWAGCKGARDPTAYVAPEQLKTPAGIDRDYNWIASIEQRRARVERQILERGLVTGDELVDAHGRWAPAWRGDELHHVLAPNHVAEGGKGFRGRAGGLRWQAENVSESQKRVRRRCREIGVEVLKAPKGISRQRQNNTTFNQRTRTLNWQVEWVFYEDPRSQVQPTKVLRKSLDEALVHSAFAVAMEWLSKSQEPKGSHQDEGDGPLKKKRRMADGPSGEGGSTTADKSNPSQKNPSTSAGDHEGDGAVKARERDADADMKQKYQFFLAKPRTNPKQLIPLTPTDTLLTALPGRSVEEFPTVYVLQPGAQLPHGHVFGSTERQVPPKFEKPRDKLAQQPRPKRGSDTRHGGRHTNKADSACAATANNSKSFVQRVIDEARGVVPAPVQPARKRSAAAVLIQDLDDGEINSDGNGPAAAEDEGDGTTSSEGSSSAEEVEEEGDGDDDTDGEGLSSDSRQGSDDEEVDDDESETELVIVNGDGLVFNGDAVVVGDLDGGGLDGKGLANGKSGSSDKGGGKKPLVVYDSWSEDEG